MSAAARAYNGQIGRRFGVRPRGGVDLGGALFVEWTRNLQRVLTPQLVDGKFGPKTIAAAWRELRSDRQGLAAEIRGVVDLSNARTNPAPRGAPVVAIPPAPPAPKKRGRGALLAATLLIGLTPPGRQWVRGLVAGLMDGIRKRRSSS